MVEKRTSTTQKTSFSLAFHITIFGTVGSRRRISRDARRLRPMRVGRHHHLRWYQEIVAARRVSTSVQPEARKPGRRGQVETRVTIERIR